jgi:hypothetical protein
VTTACDSLKRTKPLIRAVPVLTLGIVAVARLARCLRRLPAEVWGIEIILPSDAHKGE